MHEKLFMSLRKANEYHKRNEEGKPMRVMVKSGKASWEEGSEGWGRWKWIERKRKDT